MIEVELHLEPADDPQRPATAWLISGGDPVRWLDEITAWKIDEEKLTLFVIPKSRDDSSPAGLLVVTSQAHVTPAKLPGALPFGSVAEGFYIPVNAHLLPAATAAELKALKQHEVVVLHPALGPIGFAVEEALGVWDLLSIPSEREVEWANPPVELFPHPRIESISFRTEPSIQELFGPEAADIGSDSPEGLPPSKDEPRSDPLSRSLQKLRGWLGGSGKKSGRSSTSTSAFERMEQWVSTHMQGAARELARARSRSLMRLLEQLEKNPDEGLKRALPLSSSGLHRGIAPPAADLGNRATDFSLDRLGGGGGAADFWQVPPDLLQQLRLQYMQLAERERQLGRYRRAAYIHAELLGDMLAAARVLSEGDHWREAAVLYRDHLHQPLQAAECFVKARMIPEAVELYEQAHAYEPLAALYVRLGEQEKATATYRRWVSQLVDERKLLQAAAILEQQLHERNEALALLEGAWPDSPEAIRCLERYFGLRGSAGEHGESMKSLRRLAGGPVLQHRVLPLLRVLSGLQTTYTDRATRTLAEELGRQQIARCLTVSEDDTIRRMAVRLLPTLAPDDRLLTHDANRFLDQHKPKTPSVPEVKKRPEVITLAGTHSANLELLAEFRLPTGRTQWLRAAPVSGGFCAAGIVRGGVELIRSSFDGDTQTVRWHGSELPDQTIPEFLLCSAVGTGEYIFLGAVHAPPLSEHEIPESDAFSSAKVGSPGWLADPVSSAAFGPDRTLWVLRPTPTGAVISGFQERGQLVASFPAPPITLAVRVNDAVAPRMPRMHLAVAGQDVLFAAGSTLHKCGSSTRTTLAEFEETIVGLEASPPWGAPHVAILLESRIAICWLGVHQGRVHVIDIDMPGAVTGFTSDRLLVAMTRENGFLFDCDSRGRLRSARFGWNGAAPLAVLRGPVARTFTVVDVNGLVRIFAFSPSVLK
ncbi:hypothetical protein ACXR0O_16325 [Verrucomicrobiota bacterium sgz303538]